jgi:hypothetical protein
VFPFKGFVNCEFIREVGTRTGLFPELKRVPWLLMLTSCLSLPVLAQRGDPSLPNQTLTPGDTVEVTQEALCGYDYSSPAGKVSITVKRQTFDRYGLKSGMLGFNVDHLVPASLGGSNSPKNLWPQSLSGEWNYHMKNRLERTLKKMVCRKEIALEKAQQEIATDWIAAYKKYMSKTRKRSSVKPVQPNLR